ncbi:MAG: DUF2000 family protein [Patescibacteria group bacterium]|jgi:hypothetical protein
MSQDFTKRLSIIIDRSLPAWKAMNTVAHISAYFGHTFKENFGTGEFFNTKDGADLPRNTQYPIIIFAAEHDAVQSFAKDIRENTNVQKMFFTNEMVESTDDEEIQTITTQKAFDEVEILGVGIFGEHATVKTLTKKFKLWS